MELKTSNAAVVTVSDNAAQPKSGPIRVNAKTREKIEKLLEKANAKPFGRKIKASHLLEMSLSLVKIEQIKLLQEQSLSNSDRLEMLIKNASEGDPNLTKDDVIGLLLEGELKARQSKKKQTKRESESLNKFPKINKNSQIKM